MLAYTVGRQRYGINREPDVKFEFEFLKLDYCNSLLYNLSNTSISRLQRVQNSLAKVVILPPPKRFDHTIPTLAKLHWLPVKKRIEFKIAAITYKVLQSIQPSYLFEIL